MTPQKRKHKPYPDLGHTQKWVRREEGKASLRNIDVPPIDLVDDHKATPAMQLHISQKELERMRSVTQWTQLTYGKTTMNKYKRQLAENNSHACETRTFKHGAFIADPVKFAEPLIERSDVIVVGGDCGAGMTKLGLSYRKGDVMSFLCLIVYVGSDHPKDLEKLRSDPDWKTPFIGDSSDFSDIFKVLEYFMKSWHAFFNGDWPFLNAMRGQMSASATWPCPICQVWKGQLLQEAPLREIRDSLSSTGEQPFIEIPAKKFVPLPLHEILGIGNRIVALDEKFLPPATYQAYIKKVKTIHTVQGGGASDIYAMNGPELTRFIHLVHNKNMDELAKAMPSADAARFRKVSKWLVLMAKFLLEKTYWMADEAWVWQKTVENILKNWVKVTGIKPFPKLHMLIHKFLSENRFLGLVSEAAIESYHAQFNLRFNSHHFNIPNNPSERVRRCLADLTYRAVQPLLLHADRKEQMVSRKTPSASATH